MRITVLGGRITEAEAVQEPEGGPSDRRTTMAVLRYEQGAVVARSARTGTVSAATCPGTGPRQSLPSALDRARG